MKGSILRISEDHEKTLKVGNSDILAIVKELHKITVEIEEIDFTKNLPIEDNPALSADHSNMMVFGEASGEFERLIQIRKIKDYEELVTESREREEFKNQFVINLISARPCYSRS